MFENISEVQIAIEKDRIKTAIRALRIGLTPNVVAEILHLDLAKVEKIYGTIPADLIEEFDPYRNRCKGVVDLEDEAIAKAMQEFLPYMAVCLLELDIPIRIVSALIGLEVDAIEKVNRDQIRARPMEPKQYQDAVFENENGETKINLVLAMKNTAVSAARNAIYDDVYSTMMVMVDHGANYKIVDHVFQAAENFAKTI